MPSTKVNSPKRRRLSASSAKPRARKAAASTFRFTEPHSNAPVGQDAISYKRSKGVWEFVSRIRDASSMELVEVERSGVSGLLLKDLAREIDLPVLRVYHMVGVPKATAEKKVAENAVIAGAGGQAAIGMARLLGIAQSIVENSTSPKAKNFDTAKWLGRWIETAQPALGGRKPAELIDTPTGINMVARLLAAIESGAYM